MTQPIPESVIKSRRSLLERAFAALNPRKYLTGIPGPIFRKEMLVNSRRKSTYILRGGFVLIVAALMAFMLMVSLGGNASISDAAKLQQYQTIAPNVTQLVSWCMFVVLSLMAITKGGSSISDERRMGTLSALMTTPLSAWQIVIGKLFSATAELMLIGLSTIPVLLAVRAFGGVTAMTVLIAAGFTLIHALFCATVTMAWSVSAKTANAAVVRGFLTILLFQLGIPLIAMIADTIVRDVTGTGISAITANRFGVGIAPEVLFGVTLSPLNFGFAISGDASILPPGSPRTLIFIHLGYLLLLTGIFFLSTVALLRRRLSRDMDGAPDRGQSTAMVASTPTPDGPASNEQTELASRIDAARSRIVGDAPVMWREMQQGAFKRKRVMVIASILIGVLMVWAYSKTDMNDQALQIPVMIFGALCIIAFAAATTTGSFATERESRTWDTLVTTPLSAKDIVHGKFFGALRRQWFLPAILATHGLISLIGGGFDPLVILIIPILLGPVVFLTATGCHFGLIFRKGTIASSVNFVMAIVLFAIVPLMFGIASSFTAGQSLSDKILSVSLLPNPLPMTVITLEAVITGSWRYNQQMTHPFRVFDLGSYSALEYSFLILGVFAGYLAATAYMVKLSVRRLANETGRLG